MITKSMYKGKEAITLTTKSMEMKILPLDGGKISSLKACISQKNTRELMAQRPWPEYRALSYDGCYVEAECCGFDHMFPTVDPYRNGEGVLYPDHGEMCRLEYSYSLQEDKVVLKGESRILPIEYEMIFAPRKDESIDIEYIFHNKGNKDIDFLWAGHIMLDGNEAVKVVTPFAKESPKELMFGPEGVGLGDLPKDRLTGFNPGEGYTYKFYYTEAMPEGKFGVEYSDGILTFRVDPQKVPYLGMWLNNGGFQDIYTITPEPCTAPYDHPGRAKSKGYRTILPGMERFYFTLNIKWEERSL